MGQNEILFLIHLGALLTATLYALRSGPLAATLLIAVEALLANLFVVKEISLFGFSATPTDGFAVASLYGLTLIREFYGKEAAIKAAGLSIVTLLFFALMAVIQLSYFPSAEDKTQGAFLTVLGASPRIFLASLSVYAIVQQIDLWFFGRLKKEWPLFARISATLIFTETIDTVLFTFLGLYGIVASIGSILVVSLIVKWIAIGCSTPFALLARRVVRPLDVL